MSITSASLRCSLTMQLPIQPRNKQRQPLRHLVSLSSVLAALLASAELAFAFQPRLHLTPEQLAVTARRHQLPSVTKLECAALDTRLPALTQTARRTKGPDKATALETLRQARQRFQLLGC